MVLLYLELLHKLLYHYDNRFYFISYWSRCLPQHIVLNILWRWRQNVYGALSRSYTASYSRIWGFSWSALWDPQISVSFRTLYVWQILQRLVREAERSTSKSPDQRMHGGLLLWRRTEDVDVKLGFFLTQALRKKRVRKANTPDIYLITWLWASETNIGYWCVLWRVRQFNVKRISSPR